MNNNISNLVDENYNMNNNISSLINNTVLNYTKPTEKRASVIKKLINMKSNKQNKSTSNDELAELNENYNKVKRNWNNTSMTFKIIVILILFILSIYTSISFSLIYTLIIFVLLSMINIKIAIVYIIIYIILYYTSNKNNNYGTIIPKTKLDETPYKAFSASLTVTPSELPTELDMGVFSYSFWIYLTGVNPYPENKNYDYTWSSYRYGELKSVMLRGNEITSTTDLTNTVQYPGIWLDALLNNLLVVFQYGGVSDTLLLENIPFNLWTNYMVILDHYSASIYMNGKLEKTITINIPIQSMNNYNLYLTSDQSLNDDKQGGYGGFLADVAIYNTALSTNNISKIYKHYKKNIDKHNKQIKTKE